MNLLEEKFKPFEELMKSHGMPDIAIKTFKYYYKQLLEGETGLIKENDIDPVEALPDMEKFPEELEEKGNKSLSKTIILKLNGGLGTSMGLEKAKSLLKVKEDYTFLDIIANQALSKDMPLILMDSFATREDSLKVLHRYGNLNKDIPMDFLQHKTPKICQKDLSPVKWEKNPSLEWCPPGHGDIYTAMITSGILDLLLGTGYLYAFVSNADNLGAVIDKKILGYFAENNLPFMMEVAERVEDDKKCGHLARLKNGQLILREIAQCPLEDLPLFQDIRRHKYANTNTLWINLKSLKNLLKQKNSILGLSLIRNSKTVDPCDSKSTPVYQLETAMGAAIGVFEGSGAIRVPRYRFAPVKTTNELLYVRSNAYILTDDFRIIPNPERKYDKISINLDSSFYKLINDMEERFPFGAPSLVECGKMVIKGDVKFGKNVILKDTAIILNNSEKQVQIKENSVISGELNITDS